MERESSESFDDEKSGSLYCLDQGRPRGFGFRRNIREPAGLQTTQLRTGASSRVDAASAWRRRGDPFAGTKESCFTFQKRIGSEIAGLKFASFSFLRHKMSRVARNT